MAITVKKQRQLAGLGIYLEDFQDVKSALWWFVNSIKKYQILKKTRRKYNSFYIYTAIYIRSE